MLDTHPGYSCQAVQPLVPLMPDIGPTDAKSVLPMPHTSVLPLPHTSVPLMTLLVIAPIKGVAPAWKEFVNKFCFWPPGTPPLPSCVSPVHV